MTAGRAWTLLIATVTAWELYALRRDPDLLLSRGMDRARAAHPITNTACRTAIIATALHLARLIPPHLDIYRAVSR